MSFENWKILIYKDARVFHIFFALFKLRCLSLNLLSLHTTVRGRSRYRPVFVLRGPIHWHLSIFMSLSIPNLSAILGFFSHASHVSLGSSFIPSIRRLFLRDLSSNSINFADTLSAFNKSSSMALTSVFILFLFLPGIVPRQFFLRKFQTSN